MAKKKQQQPVAGPWRNRIVEHAEVDAKTLMANPKNWRKHPPEQQAALAGVLTEVGWAQNVIVNRTTGHIVDGHLRVQLALNRNETVPVAFIEVSEDDEYKLLATLDPLAAMASTDKDLLGALLHDVSSGDEAVMSLLDQLATKAGVVPGVDGSDPAPDQSGDLVTKFQVVVDCADEQAQATLLEKLAAEGLTCRALIS